MDPNWMLGNIAYVCSECQTVLIQNRPGVLLGLILVKIVCKDYQQMQLECKSLKMKVLFVCLI